MNLEIYEIDFLLSSLRTQIYEMVSALKHNAYILDETGFLDEENELKSVIALYIKFIKLRKAKSPNE